MAEQKLYIEVQQIGGKNMSANTDKNSINTSNTLNTFKNNQSFKAQEIQKKSIFKPLLSNPYTKKNQWPKVDVDIQNDIMKSLESNILPNLRKFYSLKPEEIKKLELNGVFKDESIGVCIGFNEIMKKLEDKIKTLSNKEPVNDDQIFVLFICKNDISSRLLYVHFPTICALAKVKLIQLPKGSSTKLSTGLGLKNNVTMFGVSKNQLKEDNFLYKMIDSTVEEVDIGFAQRLNGESEKLDMDVKFVLTEMPIINKSNNKKK